MLPPEVFDVYIRPMIRVAEITDATTTALPKIAPVIRPITSPITVDFIPTYDSLLIFGQPAKTATGANTETQVQARPRPLAIRPTNLKADPKAKGPHTRFRTDSNGRVTRYTSYRSNGRGGFDPKKSVDTKSGGKPHFNKDTGKRVPTPHVQGKRIPGGVRPARNYELPH